MKKIDPDNKFTRMQKDDYNRRATDDFKSSLVGYYKEHNSWKPYDDMMKDFYCVVDDQKSYLDTKEMLCLDFGCGPGRNIFKYGDAFKRIDGVDICKAILDRGLDMLEGLKYPYEAFLFHCDGVSLSAIQDDEYDVIHSTITLQHIPVHEIRLNYFYEFYRVLNEGGWITLQMGYNDTPVEHWSKNQNLRGNLFDYYENAYHVRETNGRADVFVSDPNQLEEDLIKVGFKNFEYFITDSPHPETNIHPKQIYFRAQKIQNKETS